MNRRIPTRAGAGGAAAGLTARCAAAAITLLVAVAALPFGADAQTPATTPVAEGRTRVTGVVTDVASGAPVVGATVQVVGTSFATATNDQGRYTLNVPSGRIVTVEARRLGFSVARRENLRLEDGSVTVDLAMNSNALSLEAVTVSASTDPTSGIKAPYAVSALTAEQMPVPTTASASTALIGKIAGVDIIQASGAPGAGSFIQLRSPSSPFKSNSPLWVVDGVMLNQTQEVTTQDIEAMNIESIEVIKGAAAAALYGSRAAGGVISIRTQRGRNLSLGSSQLTVRNDFGIDAFYDLPQKRMYHWYRMNDQGQFLNEDGEIIPRSQKNSGAINSARPFAENPYPVVYDNFDQLFMNGRSMQNQVSLQGNSATTNYAVTYTRNRAPGNIKDTYGYLRQSLALAFDHNMGERLTMGVSANHSRSNNGIDQVSFGNLFSIDPDVDLLARDANGQYLPRPDSSSTITNPMYLQQANDNFIRRARTIISTNVTFRPLGWLSLIGDLGYDRGDLIRDYFTPPGLVDGDNTGVTLGYLRYDEDETDGITGNVGVSAQHQLGGLTGRLALRTGMQRERNLYFRTIGTDFQVAGIRDLQAAKTVTSQSSNTERRVNSRVATLALDYQGKYVIDALVNREGNSLFGPKHRWSNWYRVGGSYLMSAEDWFPTTGIFSNLSTFKLRYNVGTAGTRPDFLDQYDAVSIFAAGFVRSDLGNPNLRPEVKTDHEMGIDAIIKNRLQVQLTYSRSNTKDAIVGIAVPSVTGYNTGQANVGFTSGHSYEATVEGIWKQTKNFRWWSNLVLDRSTHMIDEINRPCYSDGARYYCDNSPLTAMWGYRHITSLDQLRAVHADSRDQFQVNDEGYVVAVGAGNNYTDGVAKGLWGDIIRIDGVAYRFGEPILEWDEAVQSERYMQIGNGEPDFRFGLGNRFNYHDFQVYFLVNGQVGGQTYNAVRQHVLWNSDAPEMVQVGKPDELKKPYYYYNRGLVRNTTSSYFEHLVEDATHARLGELQFGYQLTSAKYPFMQHVGADRMHLQLIGRNLYTWKKSYTGLRPEGQSPTYRIDATDYPIARNYTFSVSLVF